MNYFSGKTILLISPESWSHLFVSKHHYAIELAAQGNKVFFLNPPTDAFSVRETDYPNVWEVNHKPFLKGLRFLPGMVQHFFFKRRFKTIEKLGNTKFDIVWSFDNSVFFDFSFLSRSIFSISHIVDYSQNFQFQKAAATANLCLGVSQNIVDKLKKQNEQAYLINHAIPVRRYKAIDVALPGINAIKVMYAGNLDSIYIDRPLLYTLIEKYSDVDFIFAGSGGKDWPVKSNTYFLGIIKNEELISYLKKADALLLVYDSAKHPHQLTNAHKILEYLFSGKAIVSSFVKDYEDSRLLEMAKSNEELIEVFQRVILNLPQYNDDEKMKKRIAFSENQTYLVRLNEIDKLVSSIIRETNN